MRDATHKADKMVVLHKSLAENYIKISSGFMDLSALDETNRGSDDKVSIVISTSGTRHVAWIWFGIASSI